MEVKSKQETIKSLRVPILLMCLCVVMIIALAGTGLYLVEKKKHSSPPPTQQPVLDTIPKKSSTELYQDTIKMMFENLGKQRAYGEASFKYERLRSEYAIKYYQTGNDRYRRLANTYDELKAKFAKLAYSIKIKP